MYTISFDFCMFCDTVGNSLCVLWQIVGDFLFVLGPGPFSFVASLLLPLAKRKSGWGICGSSAVFAAFSCSGDVLICQCISGTTAFRVEFLISLTCLYQFQDRALERHRPNQKKKKSWLSPGRSQRECIARINCNN